MNERMNRMWCILANFNAIYDWERLGKERNQNLDGKHSCSRLDSSGDLKVNSYTHPRCWLIGFGDAILKEIETGTNEVF